MRRGLLLSFLLFILTVLSTFTTRTPASPRTFQPIPYGSIRPLKQGGRGVVCTTFAISPKYWVTAQHCIPKQIELLTIDDQSVNVIKEDAKIDLALITSEAIAAGIELAKVEPEVGEQVWGAGFALQYPFPLLFAGIVSNPYVDQLPNDEVYKDCPVMVILGPTTFGHSGSPIVNAEGKLVGVVLGAGHPSGPAQSYGLQSPWRVVKKFLGRK